MAKRSSKPESTEPTDRNIAIVSILGKMGYKVDTTTTKTARPSQMSNDDLQTRLRSWITDDKLYEHTIMRIETMTEKALLARVNKITDRVKMLHFARVLMDKCVYPRLLTIVLNKIRENGW